MRESCLTTHSASALLSRDCACPRASRIASPYLLLAMSTDPRGREQHANLHDGRARLEKGRVSVLERGEEGGERAHHDAVPTLLICLNPSGMLEAQ